MFFIIRFYLILLFLILIQLFIFYKNIICCLYPRNRNRNNEPVLSLGPGRG
ncbi:hypothetical protein Mgra_00008880 [Meloidogyne graminicola]|uniref:Uncharacterized protein n=1 Tax=Meloidogyne graminicola TaxID=189291 RepID=A0A8S9ZEL0_9BILA|nr:hypothetical protein Mgra_00008880 [Meloidogyne graminicola]